MVTLYQAAARFARTRKTEKNRTVHLRGSPQKRGVCERVYITTPRKPCSGRRPVARVSLYKKEFQVTCHIPGTTHRDEKSKRSTHNLLRFSIVLIRGGRAADIPGVRYRIIRGAKGRHNSYGADPDPVHQRGRSKFGLRSNRPFLHIREGMEKLVVAEGRSRKLRGVGIRAAKIRTL